MRRAGAASGRQPPLVGEGARCPAPVQEDRTNGHRAQGTGIPEGSRGLSRVCLRLAAGNMRGRKCPGQRDTRPRSATAIRWKRDRGGMDARPGRSCAADSTVSAGIRWTRIADLTDTAGFRGRDRKWGVGRVDRSGVQCHHRAAEFSGERYVHGIIRV